MIDDLSSATNITDLCDMTTLTVLVGRLWDGTNANKIISMASLQVARGLNSHSRVTL